MSRRSISVSPPSACALKFGAGDPNADGTVEQGSDGRHAELRGFEHAGDGCGSHVSQIFEPLRNVRLVVLALLANFVLMPLGAFALAKVLWLDEPLELDCCCSVARPARRFCRSSLNLPRATSPLLSARWCLLMVVTVGYLPIVLPLLLPGVTVDPCEDCSVARPAHAAPARPSGSP